jgi:hypothetical protein
MGGNDDCIVEEKREGKCLGRIFLVWEIVST